MIVGVCGYGYTGSGAVLDYLSGIQSCSVLDQFELNTAYSPHGLQDLEYHLTECIARYYSSDAALKDFLKLHEDMPITLEAMKLGAHKHYVKRSRDLVNSLTQISWNGWWFYDYIRADPLSKAIDYKIIKRVEKLFRLVAGVRIHASAREVMRISVRPEHFIEKAKVYTNGLNQ